MAGSSSGNRQDNRQRGNAAQLLEKYKSMARDAQLAGDRVQTEYFLQFADHYFRVLDDGRARFDEQKRQRGDDDSDDDGDDRMEIDIDSDNDSDGEAEEQPQRRQTRSSGDRPNQQRRDRPNVRARDDDGRGRGPARDGDGGERIDYAVLPPAIRADGNDDSPQSNDDDEDEAPKPRRRARRPRADEVGIDDAPAS